MRTISRRRALASFGLLGSSTLLAGCGRSSFVEAAASAGEPESCSRPPASPVPSWTYVILDAPTVAETAYRIYPEGGCMYAVVGGVITELAKKAGDPFRSFPIEMMRYGDGGVGAWGSLCGVVNGGSALLGLFHGEKSKTTREELINSTTVVLVFSAIFAVLIGVFDLLISFVWGTLLGG